LYDLFIEGIFVIYLSVILWKL